MSAPILSIRNAAVSFAKKLLFEDLSLNLFEGDRICLIGKNGAGKTSLMNAIFGRIEFDEGERWVMPGAHLGYLEQNEKLPENLTIEQYILQEIALDEHKKYLIDMICEKLKIDKNALTHNLSGGQRRRANLAKVLVLEPEILLLDEPTNHLDLEIIEWLEDYLTGFRGALLVISHDRKFLEKVSNKVFWLRAGAIKINHHGYKNFDEWSQAIIDHENRELVNLEKKFELESGWLQTGVTARRKRNVGRLHYLEELKQKMKMQKQVVAANQTKMRIHAQDKFDEDAPQVIASFNNVTKGFGGDIEGQTRGSAPTELEFVRVDPCVHPLKHTQTKTILKNFSLKIMRGDKIGIIGKNGSGKSTFLKLLVGQEKPNHGTVKIAPDLHFSYFDQDRISLKGNKSVKEVLCENGSDYVQLSNGKVMHVCGYLRNFLFDAKDTETLVSTLSGGQQNRLLLAKNLANPGNFLILDEPTNDLDMESLDILQNYLEKYQGTLLVVSHDRDFLDNTVGAILAFEEVAGDEFDQENYSSANDTNSTHTKITYNLGGYSDYIDYITKFNPCQAKSDKKAKNRPEGLANCKEKNNISAICQAKSDKKATNGKNDAKLPQNNQKIAENTPKTRQNRSKLQKEADKIAEKIDKIEQKILELSDELNNTEDRNPANLAQISIEIGNFQKQIEQFEERWMEIENELRG